MLRRIFGLKREKVTAGWRKLRNEELHNLYSSPSITTTMKSKKSKNKKKKSNAYRISLGKPKGNIPLRRRWADNIKMDFGEIRWGDTAQDGGWWSDLEKTVSKPSGCIKCYTIPESLHIWRFLVKGSAP
jgi:hypothetical protein